MRILTLVFALAVSYASAQFDLNLSFLAGGYDRPCDIVNAGDERLFVVEQVGRISILLPDGTQFEEPFLDITGPVDSQGGEKGLLGLAFPPDYCSSGVFYVNYTVTVNSQLRTRISRFSVNPDDENQALTGSEEVVLEFNQDFANHNGGQLEFGPDGFLYIATGDGGSAGDPNNRAQNTQSLLGKMLRINVSNSDTYTVPEDNPFVTNGNGREEIWAYGLRNPWKFAFDEITGDLYIGDVGQSNREEINYLASGTPGGTNFGWRCYEGTATYNTSGCSGPDAYTMPVFEYNYGLQGNGFRCSNTGGRVYRGTSFDNLQGKYMVADFCSGEYWVLWQEGGEWQNFAGTSLATNIVAFGADVWGEMYVVRGSNGTVSRLIEGDQEINPQINLSGNTLSTILSGSEFIWTFNGEVIEGANTAELEIQSNGIYGLTVISPSGCEISAIPLTITNLSVWNTELVTKFDVFPNPARELVRIEAELKQPLQAYVTLYSVQGKKIQSQLLGNSPFSAQVSITDVLPGMYIVTLSDREGVILASKKLVVE